VLAVGGLFAPASATTALGANKGHVWTRNVAAGSGPADIPHLPCEDINLWGSDLAIKEGAYTIIGVPPSGSGKQDYESSWKYEQPRGESEVISVIRVKKLIKRAAENGDAPENGQGYKFKLQVSQEPKKSKVFWVNCEHADLANLSIAKHASIGTVGPGRQVLYTLTVESRGPGNATGLIVSDTPPAGLSVSAARPSQGSCTITDGHLSCALGALAAGGSAQVLVSAMTSASASGSLTNTATVTADQPDPNRANNTASSTVTVPASPPAREPPADLEVTGHVDHTTVDVGETLIATGVVDNLGPGTAEHVELVATPSQPVKLVSINTDAGHCQDALPLRCTLGTIPAGARVTIRIVVIPLRAGSLRSAASVTGAEPHPTTANNLAIVTTPIKHARRARRRAPPPPRRPPPVTG
jgi:uncharacterized repeat protein (TIGR01451 family)